MSLGVESVESYPVIKPEVNSRIPDAFSYFMYQFFLATLLRDSLRADSTDFFSEKLSSSRVCASVTKSLF